MDLLGAILLVVFAAFGLPLAALWIMSEVIEKRNKSTKTILGKYVLEKTEFLDAGSCIQMTVTFLPNLLGRLLFVHRRTQVYEGTCTGWVVADGPQVASRRMLKVLRCFWRRLGGEAPDG